jgi:hypothetical protein
MALSQQTWTQMLLDPRLRSYLTKKDANPQPFDQPGDELQAAMGGPPASPDIMAQTANTMQQQQALSGGQLGPVASAGPGPGSVQDVAAQAHATLTSQGLMGPAQQPQMQGMAGSISMPDFSQYFSGSFGGGGLSSPQTAPGAPMAGPVGQMPTMSPEQIRSQQMAGLDGLSDQELIEIAGGRHGLESMGMDYTAVSGMMGPVALNTDQRQKLMESTIDRWDSAVSDVVNHPAGFHGQMPPEYYAARRVGAENTFNNMSDEQIAGRFGENMTPEQIAAKRQSMINSRATTTTRPQAFSGIHGAIDAALTPETIALAGAGLLAAPYVMPLVTGGAPATAAGGGIASAELGHMAAAGMPATSAMAAGAGAGSIATQGMINLAGEPIAGQVIPHTTVASTLGGHIPAGSSGLLGGLAGKIGSKELLALNMASSMFQQPQVQQQYYRNQREYAR